LVRLDEDELEVVKQVLDSVEVLELSFGDIPRLNLDKYATFAEEEYRLLQQQQEGEA
jgi:hypothetical protein